MRTLPAAVLVLSLSWACGPSPSAPTLPESTLPSVPSTPAPTRYHVSGFVADEHGSPAANAPVDVWYSGPDEFRAIHTAKKMGTFTTADGRYDVSFEVGSPGFLGNANVVGLVRTRTMGQNERVNDIQLLPAGKADIVRNLRYRHVPTIDAGGSIAVSIGSESPRTFAPSGDIYGTSNPPDLSRVGETFRVIVGASGTLTVGLQLGFDAALRGSCWWGKDCSDEPFTQFTQSSPGSISAKVQDGSIYQLTVSIPSVIAPQRYEVTTSIRP